MGNRLDLSQTDDSSKRLIDLSGLFFSRPISKFDFTILKRIYIECFFMEKRGRKKVLMGYIKWSMFWILVAAENMVERVWEILNG